MSTMPTFEPTNEPAPDLDGPPPAWPKVIGLISTIWGGLGMLCGVCGMGALLMQPSLLKMAEKGMGGPPPDVMLASPAQKIVGLASLIPTALLLAGGITTLRRSASGRFTHIAYALLSVPIAAYSFWLAVQQNMALEAWIRDNSGDKWAASAKPGLGIVIAGFFTLVGVAYALFCLVWFGPMGKKPEVGAPAKIII